MSAAPGGRRAAVRLARRGMRRQRRATLLGVLLFALPVCAFVAVHSAMYSDYGRDPADRQPPPGLVYLAAVPCGPEWSGDGCIPEDAADVLGDPLGSRLRAALGPAADRAHLRLDWFGGVAAGAGGPGVRASASVGATGAPDADDVRAAGEPPAGTALPRPPAPGTVDVPDDVAAVLGVGPGDPVRLLLPDGGDLPVAVGAVHPGGGVEANIADVPQLVPDPAAPASAVPAGVDVSWWLPVRPGPVLDDAAGVVVEATGGGHGAPPAIWEGLLPGDYGVADYAAAACLMVLGVICIAAVAAPVFAVSARRRRRELGLLASIGARPSHLRAVMLAEGLLTGVLGAAAGVAASLPASRAWHAAASDPGGRLHWSWSAAVVAAAAAVVCGAVAALWPAMQAAAEDPATALADGSRSYRPRAGGWTWAGPVLFAGSLLALTRVPGDWRAIAVILAVLGLVLAAPALTRAAARPGPLLPTPARMAARDAVRSGARTPAGIAAVTAVTAVGALLVLLPVDRPAGRSPLVIDATPMVSVNTAAPYEQRIRDRMDRVGAIARADTWRVAEPMWLAPVLPDGAGGAGGGAAPEVGGGAAPEAGPPPDARTVTIADPAWVRMLPPDDAGLPGLADRGAAEVALARGAALVADPGFVRDGHVTVALCGPEAWQAGPGPLFGADAGGRAIPSPAAGGSVPADCAVRSTLRVPAVVEPGIAAVAVPPDGSSPGGLTVVISPDTARGLTGDLRFQGTALLLGRPPGVVGALAAAVRPAGGGGPELFWSGDEEALRWLRVAETMAAVTVFSLAVVALVIVLASRENRADLRLLRALGARPATVRRYAGAQGLMVAVPGGVTGAAGAVVLLAALGAGVSGEGLAWLLVAGHCAVLVVASWLVGVIVGARGGDGPPARRRG